jgi:hypothetical protein
LNETNKKDFALMMRVTWANYGRNEVDKDTLRYWFGKLEKFEFEQVTKAFDDWIDSSKNLPTIKDIQDGCKPKPTIFARLPSPLAIAENHRHALEVKDAVEKMTQGKRDMKAWARKIKSNPSAYPDISLRYANEALGAE